MYLGNQGSGGGSYSPVPTGGGLDKVFYENSQYISQNYDIALGVNAMTAGTITVNSGVTVSVAPGSTWTIV